MSEGNSQKTTQAELPEAQQKLRGAVQAEFGDALLEVKPHAWKEYGLSYQLDRSNMLEVFKTLRDGESFLFNMLVDVTAVDWLDNKEPRFEVIYHLLSITLHHRICIRVGAEEQDPEVDSIVSLWKAANFLEREVWDMYGISFKDHGDLRRILMYDEFVGHPLRKDYPVTKKQPRVEMRVPELRNTSADLKREQLVSLPVRQRVPSPKEQ